MESFFRKQMVGKFKINFLPKLTLCRLHYTDSDSSRNLMNDAIFDKRIWSYWCTKTASLHYKKGQPLLVIQVPSDFSHLDFGKNTSSLHFFYKIQQKVEVRVQRLPESIHDINC